MTHVSMNTFPRIHGLALAVTYLALSLAHATAAEIRLRPRCEVETSLVTLADLAEIRSVAPEESKRLAAIELFPAPPVSRPRFVHVQEIQEALLLRGINLAEHRFSGASQVEVSRGKSVEDTPPAASPVIAASYMAVVAARPLSRNAVIGLDDVLLQPVPDDRTARGFDTLDAVVGMEVSQSVPEGRVLESSSLRAPLLVERGDTVTVSAIRPGIRVRTQARAREAGSMGQLIAVESLSDRSRYFARVSGVRAVVVCARTAQVSSETTRR